MKCEKVKHESLKEAEVHIWMLRKKKEMNAYKCKQCSYYHIGHKPGHKRKAA